MRHFSLVGFSILSSLILVIYSYYRWNTTSIMSRHMVFVYGSLKRKQPNHHWLTERENGEAVMMGLATSQEKYPLVVASRYNIPFVLAAPGQGKQIEGEVYEVDDQMMARLDVLEAHPRFYERKVIKANMQDSGKEIDCWIYLLHDFRPELLELPTLSTYFSKGDFVTRDQRKVAAPEYWTDIKLPGTF